MTKYTNQSVAYKWALATVFLWSTVATAFKIGLADSSPLQLVIVSCLVSSLCLAVLYFVLERGRLTDLTRHFLSHPIRFVAAGVINPLLYYFVLFQAYDLLPAQVAQPINYTWAIVLSLLAVPVLKQRLTTNDIIGLVLCYVGVFILVTRLEFDTVNQVNWQGVILAIVSTLLWAGYWLITTPLTTPPLATLLLNFLISTPIMIVMLTLNWPNFSFSFSNVAAAVYIGLFEMSVAFVMWLKAMRIAENTAQISSLIYLSPFISLLFIYFVLGETIYPTTIVALVVIVVGLAIQRLKTSNTQ